MDIYVMTRGLKLEQDYHWEKVTENSQSRQNPPLQIIRQGNLIEINDLIHSKDFSLSLARSSAGLFLLITGLSSQFKDPHSTKIRNSICWLANNLDEELMIQGLAIKFLQEDEKSRLENKINDCITRHHDGSFFVDAKQIKDIELNIDISELTQEQLLTEEVKIIKIDENSAHNRKKLAEQLIKYSLPSNQEIFVIVTTRKEGRKLKQAGVWRGLTNITTDIAVPSSEPNLFELINLIFKQKLSLIYAAIAILTTSLILAVFVIHPTEHTPPQQPAIEIFYDQKNLSLEVNLNNDSITLYYRGGFSEEAITKKLEGISISRDKLPNVLKQIDGPNPSKPNTTYKYIISDRQIEDQEIKQLFSTDISCSKSINKISQYPVILCIKTPKEQ
jgi:hypothetical protein